MFKVDDIVVHIRRPKNKLLVGRVKEIFNEELTLVRWFGGGGSYCNNEILRIATDTEKVLYGV